MKKNRKKQKGKKHPAVAVAAAEAAAKLVDPPIIGIKIESTLNSVGKFSAVVVAALNSDVFYNSSRDLTHPFSAKDIRNMKILFQFLGLKGHFMEGEEQAISKKCVVSGRFFVQTQRSFEDIKGEVEKRIDPNHGGSLSQCYDAARKQIAFLLHKDPRHEYLTFPEDYARRISQHLFHHTGKEYKIYVDADSQMIDCQQSRWIRVFGVETEPSMTKEVTQGLRNHPPTSLHMVLYEDVNSKSMHLIKESKKALESYVGLRVFGLAKSNVDELRALIQNMKGPPNDLDATADNERMGEYVILTHPDCKAAVLQQVRQYLSTSNTINTRVFPNLYPNGPCVAADEDFQIISPGYKAISTFLQAAAHIDFLLDNEGQVEPKINTKVTELVVSILVALKRYPDDRSLHRNACFALAGIHSRTKRTAVIAKLGGIQALISVMKNHPTDKFVQLSVLRLFYSNEAGTAPMLEETKDAILACMADNQDCHDIQQHGLNALWRPSRTNPDPYEDVALAKDVLRVCVDSMAAFQDSFRLQTAGGFLLNSILARKPDNALLDFRVGGAAAILRVARNMAAPASLHRGCCYTLSLFLVAPELQQQCFECVVKMMRLHRWDASVQEYAGEFFSTAIKEESTLHLFEEPGPIGCLATALADHPEHPGVLGSCCNALSLLVYKKNWETFAEGDYVFHSFVRGAGGAHLPDDDDALHLNILGAIATLCQRRTEHSDAIIASLTASETGGILAFLAKVMERHPSDKTKIYGCFGLIHSFSFGYGKDQISLAPKQSFIVQTIRLMQTYRSDEQLQHLACTALFRLTATENSGILGKLSKLDAIGSLLQAILKFQHNDEIRNKGGIVVFRVRDFEVANGLD